VQDWFEKAAGCLLGGAVGDALGWPVEFSSWPQIKRKFGPKGITGLVPGPGGLAEITDDTQMTLFTAEGLLCAAYERQVLGTFSPADAVYLAYLRWLHTQGMKSSFPGFEEAKNQGWLLKMASLYQARAPGVTCVNALARGLKGTPRKPVNDSKGCGGVMRVAPVGIAPFVKDPFTLGCELAALPHGHPTGWLAAGAFALIIGCLVEGAGLVDAVEESIERLVKKKDSQECRNALTLALRQAETRKPSVDTVEEIGEGWTAEEALAVAVYCALVAEGDFRTGLLLAVNHSGDSDSTGSMTGNILGLICGRENIPREWREGIELSGVIEEMASDLVTGYEDSDSWREKYGRR